MKNYVSLALWCLLVVPCQSQQANTNPETNWPQWRGPSGNGVASDANPPTQWGPTQNIRWRTALPGRGHSTPVVWDDFVFVTAAVPVGPRLPPKTSGRPGAHDNLPIDSEHRFVVIAIHRDDGKVIWEKTVHQAVPHEGGHNTASLASASPVTDGKHVYAFFGSYGLVCLDLAGEVVWQKQLGKMHSKHGHGEGASPTMHKNTLLVNWDHEEQSFVVAINTANGQEIWRKDRTEVTSWSSPLIVQHDGITQAIVCGTNRVRSYDLSNGDVIWECGGMSANIVATPVSADGILYVGSSYEKRAFMAINLTGAKGDITGSDQVLWSKTRGTPYVPSPLLYDGALYFLTHYQNVITRVSAKSGNDEPGAMRLGELGNIYASPVGAGGHVYITDLDGVTQVITNTEIPRTIAVNRVGESISASAAIAGDHLFLRGDLHLFCVGQ